MEQLHLRLVGPEDGAFAQYVPGNLRPLLGRDGVVCALGSLYMAGEVRALFPKVKG